LTLTSANGLYSDKSRLARALRTAAPPPPRAEGTLAAGRAVVDEPRLVEAGDQAGEERGVQGRGHGHHAGVAQA
jgi:hypothetical protein